MKTFFQNTLPLLFLIFMTTVLSAQTFSKLYVGADTQAGAVVKIYDNHIYRVGSIQRGNDFIGTFSKYTMTGDFLWMVELDRSTALSDFVEVIGANGTVTAFLIVGRTMPFNSGTDTQSVLARVDINGNLDWTRYFETTGREAFTRIVKRTGDTSAFPYYILSWLNKNQSPSTSDDAAIFRVDENGTVSQSDFYRTATNSDYQVTSVLLPLQNGRLAMMGSYTPWVGHIITIRPNGTVLRAHDLSNDVRIYDAEELANGDLMIVGTIANDATGFIARIQLNANGGNVIWSALLPAFTRLSQVSPIDPATNQFYAVAFGNNASGVLQSTVLQFQDNGTAQPTINWSRLLNEGETFFGGASIEALANGSFLYHDVRTGNPNGLGGQEFLMGIFDSAFNSCITVDTIVELTPLEFEISLNEVTNTELAYEVETVELASNLELEEFPLCCGGLTNDTLDFSCTPQNAYDFTFDLQNFTGYTVTSVLISVDGPYSIGSQQSVYYTQNNNSNLPIAANGGLSGPFNITIVPDNPVTTPTTVCLDIIYISDDYQCCHYEYCVTLEPIDPCAYIDLISTKLDTDEGCCYDMEVVNNYCDDYFVGIQTEILTPGVSFASFNGGSTWTTAANSANTTVDWTPNSGFILTGNTLDMNFCLEGIVTYSQIPQEIAFNWLAIDPATGETIIACTDTLEFECETCIILSEEEVFCDENGNYFYTFTLLNNTVPPKTATNIALEVYTPAGVDFNLNTIPVNLSSGSTHTETVAITGPVSAGDIISYKVLLLDDEGWCCHLDSLEFVLPDCEIGCTCTDFDDYVEDVNQGFDLLLDCTIERSIFTPLGTSECDTTRWSFTLVGSNPILSGLIPGDSPALFDFPVEGTYEVCLQVFRYDEDGNLCYGDITETYCEQVELGCPNDDEFILNGEAAIEQDNSYDLNNLTPPVGDFKGILQDNTASVHATIYPNPATDNLTIELDQDGLFDLSIYTINGVFVQRAAINSIADSPMQVSIANLLPGVYVISVEGETGQVLRQRFVKVASW